MNLNDNKEQTLSEIPFKSLDSLVQEISGIKKAWEEKGKETLKKIFIAFFKENPTVKGVNWCQYTPWFNDGETCIFSVREPEFLMEHSENGADQTKAGFYLGDYNNEENDELGDKESPNRWMSPSSYRMKELQILNPVCEACLKLTKALESIEDILENVFGNHVKVTVLEDGRTITEEYEHD